MNRIELLRYIFQRKCKKPMIDLDEIESNNPDMSAKARVLYYHDAVFFAFGEVEIYLRYLRFLKREVTIMMILTVMILNYLYYYSDIVKSFVDILSNFFHVNFYIIAYIVIMINYLILNGKYKNIGMYYASISKIYHKFHGFLSKYGKEKRSNTQKLFENFLTFGDDQSNLIIVKSKLNEINNLNIFSTERFRKRLEQRKEKIYQYNYSI